MTLHSYCFALFIALSSIIHAYTLFLYGRCRQFVASLHLPIRSTHT